MATAVSKRVGGSDYELSTLPVPNCGASRDKSYADDLKVNGVLYEAE